MRLVEELGGSWRELTGEQLPSMVNEGSGGYGDVVRLPLVAEKIAAGFGSVPQEAERGHYIFRSNWKALKAPKDETRYRMARLDKKADSMEPEIRAGSILLFDMSEDVRANPEWGKPYLVVVDRRTDEVALKELHPIRTGSKVSGLLLESRNRGYPPMVIPLEKGERLQRLVRAKLVWHGTEW
jgi:hypothetical protein